MNALNFALKHNSDRMEHHMEQLVSEHGSGSRDIQMNDESENIEEEKKEQAQVMIDTTQ